MFNNNRFIKQQHPFHMVTPSPWPLLVAFSFLCFFLSVVIYFHYWRTFGFYMSFIVLTLCLYCIFCWFADVILESTFQGNHTIKVYKSLRLGMLLFITSEVMFFFAFFWAFFHSSLVPSIFIGVTWPPVGITVLNLWGLPFLNTIFLLSSGVMVTWAHRGLLASNQTVTLLGLFLTILLGIIFTICQLIEYFEAPFSISSGIYGSIFFLTTGFHGFHVILGTIFLIVCLLRCFFGHFSNNRHFGFEAASWYWHFVDVVWLFLFTVIYWWGN